MADIEEKNKETSPAETPPIQSSAAKMALPAPCEGTEKKPMSMTAGRRIHNEITYRGIDWILNSTVGVAFAYWSARTKSGEKYFGKPVSGFFKKILRPLLKNEKSVDEGAKWGTMFAGIMAGGFTIIPPMMVMESKKIKKGIIRWLDEKIYGKEKVANDPQFAQCYRDIDDEPHKDFATGMAARLIAIAPLIAAASTPAVNKPLIKYLYDPIGKLSKWITHTLRINPGKMAIEGALERVEGDPNLPKTFQSNWDFLHRTIGFDFGLTIFYSIFHEIAYKGLAAFKHKKDPENIATPDLTANPDSSCIDKTGSVRQKRFTDHVKSKKESGILQDKSESYVENFIKEIGDTAVSHHTL